MGLTYRTYLEGSRVFGCSKCRTHLSTTESIISKAFQGQHGRAYLFDNVVNVEEGPSEDRHMTTGLHTVKDISCSRCRAVLGWKYEKAYEQSQRYKEGRYILEKQLLCEESLTIKPLSDGKLLTHFQFSIQLEGAAREGARFNHYNLFPRAIGQIVQQYSARELHLTFTQGRWEYEKWGYPLSFSAGTGVELWAWLWKNEKLDDNWKSLTNALAGLFCASLNFIDETKTVQPQLSFRPEGPHNDTELFDSAELRSGSLPHENVCTENLTPWIKLLPCKSTAGIASLLNGHELYNSNFHSMSINVRPICQDSECTHQKLEILQTLSTVINPVRNKEIRGIVERFIGFSDWSLNELYSRKISRACPLAKESNLLLIIPEEGDFEIMPEADQVIKGETVNQNIAIYDLKKDPHNLELSMKWNESQFTYDNQVILPRVFAHRYFSGYGQERGGIKVNIFNKSPDLTIPIVYYDVIPWYLKLYLHTLKVKINGVEVNSKSKDYPIKDLYYQPAVDRSRPAVIEALIHLPSNSITTLSILFDKVFLKYTEHPPDPNRGFDVGPAVITVISSNEAEDNQKKAEGYGLPTPDFSMPYNVITLTCTVLALFFGSMFNLLTRQFVGLLTLNDEKIDEGKQDENKDIVDRKNEGTEKQILSEDK
ncbi:11666_t:CDS:10 [Ambispora gerdemannii]|uniref:11666_t:CDS:1 n=1 Tax=Ambispora gerdemannii TaxID=144530 RepID=A0A9N8W1X3_9GLOM|nr:11666_t:CDS:10 [Ambispora gerdemannii]